MPFSTRWRRALADRWRQYLMQQAELGGAEIYVEKAGQGGREAGRPPEESTASRSPGPPGAPAWQRGAPPIPGPGLTVDLPAPDLLGDGLGQLETLEAIAERVAGCTRCALASGRKRTVPGEGNPSADLMLVGEGPGAKEDETGRPFVGAAGELLTQILASIGIPREDVFIANVVKCRPPQNRKPLPDESAACLPYLRRQVQLVRPKVLLALGGTAAEALLGVRQSLGKLRGAVHSYGGVPLVVTYHPAALLRNPNWKKPTWDDVRIARQLLDR
jgi:uracil-DNA glycosylase family 4